MDSPHLRDSGQTDSSPLRRSSTLECAFVRFRERRFKARDTITHAALFAGLKCRIFKTLVSIPRTTPPQCRLRETDFQRSANVSQTADFQGVSCTIEPLKVNLDCVDAG